MRGSGTKSKRRARGSLDATGLPDPDLIDHLPIQVIALLTSPRLRQPRSADRAGRIPVIRLADEHGPDHTRHFVRQCDGDQFAWFACEHAR